VADREGRAPRKLREIITAGARPRLTPALRRLMKRLSGGVLELQYGPPEAPVAMARRLEGNPEEWPEWPCLGAPIANTRVHLLDGELCIAGAAVARGYLHRLELTRERFLEEPFAVAPGRRLYRTGECARFLPDGSLELLRRKREAR
jgi:non-ribosomal peptide synthetase component F